jgi:hypothetical protein
VLLGTTGARPAITFGGFDEKRGIETSHVVIGLASVASNRVGTG